MAEVPPRPARRTLAKHVRLRTAPNIVAAVTTDVRFADDVVRKNASVAVPVRRRALGQVLRLPFSPFRQPSTKAGRRYCRLAKQDRVVHVEFVEKADTIFLISQQARLIHFGVEDVPILSGPGKGVRGLKLVDAGDQVLGGRKLSRPSDALRVVNEHDRELAFGQQKYQVTSRGGKGSMSQRTASNTCPPEISGGLGSG